MSFIVYMHTFKSSNKSYIGYTSLTISKRLYKHIYNSQCGHDTHFYRAIRKYGVKDIESKIICECKSKKEALEKEAYYIDLYNTQKNGYNMTSGGEGGFIISKDKYEAWKEKKSKAMSGEKNSRYSGITDHEILEKAYIYFNENGSLPKRKWQIYSSEKYNFPKFYSKFRFEKYGSGLTGFVNAMKEIYNLKDEDFVYKRTKLHQNKITQSLLETNKGKK